MAPALSEMGDEAALLEGPLGPFLREGAWHLVDLTNYPNVKHYIELFLSVAVLRAPSLLRAKVLPVLRAPDARLYTVADHVILAHAFVRHCPPEARREVLSEAFSAILPWMTTHNHRRGRMGWRSELPQA